MASRGIDVSAVDLPLYGRTTSPDPTAVRYDTWIDLLDAGVAAPLSAGDRKRATHWERWIDDQVIARGQHRPQHFGTHADQHHRFAKRA